MFKKILSLILIFICILPCAASADATVDRARVLYDMGLLKGTGIFFSESSLELNRNATRAEMCTTVVRMLGKEAKASYQQNAHPFSDVPYWASDNIGWLYENYLVNGVSDTYFGANDVATVQQFCAMLLRTLGYDDSRGDFHYSNAVNVAVGCGIAESRLKNVYELSRRDMINMCYNALRANIKNSSRSLIQKLCDEKVVSLALAEKTGLLKQADVSDFFTTVPDTLGKISVIKKNANTFCINFAYPAEEYGLRVFVLPKDGTMMEISYSGDVYIRKGDISYSNGSPAGYVDKLYIYGLDTSRKYSFIVVKTTSEGAIYNTVGKSGVCYN